MGTRDPRIDAYIERISQAKSDATRQRRLATAVEWIEEGKSRHWKYQKG